MKCRQNCEIWIFEKEKDNTVRHGIYQIFYTNEIPNPFQFYPKKGVNRNIFGEKLRTEYVLLSIFNNLSVFVHLSIPIQTLTSNFVKTLTWIWQIWQYSWIIALILDNFTPSPKHFTQVPLVTNSMSEHSYWVGSV